MSLNQLDINFFNHFFKDGATSHLSNLPIAYFVEQWAQRHFLFLSRGKYLSPTRQNALHQFLVRRLKWWMFFVLTHWPWGYLTETTGAWDWMSVGEGDERLTLFFCACSTASSKISTAELTSPIWEYNVTRADTWSRENKKCLCHPWFLVLTRTAVIIFAYKRLGLLSN